jgi:DNA-binding MarR family transcriptional regulator
MSEKSARPPATADVMRAWQALMPDKDLSGLAIGAQLGRLHVLSTRILNELGKAHGINSLDISILMAIRRLSREKPTRPTELWRLFDLTPGAITYRINRLTEMGLVERSGDDADGRSILIALTPQGMTMINAVAEAISAEWLRRLGGLEKVPGGREMLGFLLDHVLAGWEDSEG